MTAPDVPYRFELDLVVPGSPEQVWRAIATAGGISAWMVPTDLDPRVGGAVAFHMGSGETSHGRVTGLEPGRRFAYEEDWASLVGQAGAPVTPLVTEFLVDARSGGTCVVRVVTSAFGTGADWEQEFFDEMLTGWAPMLDNLRLYLTHFPDQQVASLWAGTMFAVPPVEAIAAIRVALGVEAVGDPLDARGVAGRIERSVERHFLARIESPVPGFLSFLSFSTDDDSSGVHLQGHLFSAAASRYVDDEQPAWQAWLDQVATDVAAPQT